MSGDPWSPIYHARRKIRDHIPTVFSLPLAKRHRDLVAAGLSGNDRVLEVGAYDRRLGSFLQERFPSLIYESLDPDTSYPHEYRRPEEVEGTFDAVVAFEVLEHLSLPEIREMLLRMHGWLKPGGRLFLSVPNIFKVGQYFRDATHRTPLAYDELGGMVAAAGFEVTHLVRVYNAPFFSWLLRRVLAYPLYRILEIDFAGGIFLGGVRR